MFKMINFKVDLFASPFENLKYRDRTVLILPKDSSGKFILGAKKDFYPKGIVRMIGGGMDDGEDILSAAVREFEEETSRKEPANKFVPLVEIKVEGKFGGETYTHTIFVYFLQLESSELKAGDDISEIVRFTEEDLRQLVANYYALANDSYFEYPGGKFSWGDYGKVYGFIHLTALDQVLAKHF